MSDARLRALERASAAGDLEARARLLRERVRLGTLAGPRLELAAQLGDPSARAALGDAAPAEVTPEATWQEAQRRWASGGGSRVWLAKAVGLHARRWCEALSAYGPEPLVRVALAAARAVADRVEPHLAGPPARAAREAAEAWLRGEGDSETCARAGDEVTLAARQMLSPTPTPAERAAYAAATAASMAAYTAGSLVPETAAHSAAHALRAASDAWALARAEGTSAEAATADSPGGLLHAPVWAAVRDEVVPWALGVEASGSR